MLDSSVFKTNTLPAQGYVSPGADVKRFFGRSGEFYTYKSQRPTSPPAARTSKYQSSFRINGVRTWNTLSKTLRNEQNFLTFKRRLKNYLKDIDF